MFVRVCVCVHYQCFKLRKCKVIGVCLVFYSLMDRASCMWRPCMTTKQPRMETLVSGWETRLKSSKTVSWNLQPLCIALCVAHHMLYIRTYSRAVWISVCCSGVLSCLSLTVANLRLYVQSVYICVYVAMSVVKPSLLRTTSIRSTRGAS